LAKPAVDGLERNLQGRASVIRLDVTSQVGRQAAAYFGVRAVPTLLLVDAHGEVILTQVGYLKPSEVQHRAEELILTGGR